MNHADLMRQFMALTEADYTGPVDSPNVSYSHEEKKGEITKVIANLSSHESGKYTKLGRNLNRIKWLSDKIDQLKEEVKGETKGAIVDLFHADDACRTRVVETVGFTFHLTKDPDPTTTVQYAKVLKALEEHLTPELIAVMETLKAQFSSVTQKSPALKATDKRYESIEEAVQLDEGFLDSIKSVARKVYDKVKNWGQSYDAKLNKLKSMASVTEAIQEDLATDVLARYAVGDRMGDSKWVKLNDRTMISKAGDEFVFSKYLPGQDRPHTKFVSAAEISDYGVPDVVMQALGAIDTPVTEDKSDSSADTLIYLLVADAINLGRALGANHSQKQIDSWDEKVSKRKQVLTRYLKGKN